LRNSKLTALARDCREQAGDFPNLAKLAVGDYGDKAIVELRDLVGKIGEINPTIADLYGPAIKSALAPFQWLVPLE